MTGVREKTKPVVQCCWSGNFETLRRKQVALTVLYFLLWHMYLFIYFYLIF